MIEDRIYNFIKKIYRYPRSITGIGTLKTLQNISHEVPNLKIQKIK